jgi:hypothetical protein
LPEHCVALGVHAGAAGQVHAPHPQPALQVCVPYVLHDCVACWAHAPWPVHVPSCHAPLGLHVWTSVPQLPHAIDLV